ncbi:MAG: DUF4956 domain-containing protein [Oscillospiraceae bacterium]|nr:DUF4956 domain-containing protein [Oscillospiraceae bacterium]
MNNVWSEITGFFSSIDSDSTLPPVWIFALILVCMVLFGVIVSITYMLTDKNKVPAQSFALTLVLLPAIVCTIVMMVGNSLAGALSLGGAFAIIRFRSVPGDPKDILYILFCMAIGLPGGRNHLIYSLCVTIVLCSVMFVMHFVRFAAPRRTRMILKITIPEDFNYHNAFDDILRRYASSISRQRVRTTDLGSLFEISFALTIMQNADEKAMIDELRSRNGNLPIVLVLHPQTSEYKE